MPHIQIKANASCLNCKANAGGDSQNFDTVVIWMKEHNSKFPEHQIIASLKGRLVSASVDVQERERDGRNYAFERMGE